MSSLVAKYVGRKILGETRSNKYGQEDPFFEQVPAGRLARLAGKKTSRRRKALPPGISDHDGRILTKVKRRAYRLDLALFNCCGIRFGWGSVLGLIPVIGDVMDMLLALMVLKTCTQIQGGLPAPLRVRMMTNIVIDFVVGLVPFVGDLADALYKANTRNALLLEEHLREKGRKDLRQSGQPIPTVDPSDPAEFDKDQYDTRPDRVHEQPGRHEPMSSNPSDSRKSAPALTVPDEARTREQRGFFGRSKARPHDVEAGRR